MNRPWKHQTADAAKTNRDHVSNLAAMTERLGVSTVPAAWPQGVTQFAQAIDACQRCNSATVCSDWLTRAPASFDVPPPFCPNEAVLKAARASK